jgi:hypothetical protein
MNLEGVELMSVLPAGVEAAACQVPAPATALWNMVQTKQLRGALLEVFAAV